MKTVGLVIHRHSAEVLATAKSIVAYMESAGVAVAMVAAEAALVGREDLTQDNFGIGLEACISVGGDGTILSAVRRVASSSVPILGINAGRMGYLAEVEPDRMSSALDALLAGNLDVETRMMLDVELPDGSVQTGLNEVVVSRKTSGHSVLIGASIDGSDFLSYSADGVILATPTGSTAYSLAAGGPVVEPGFQALVMTPVAAHMVFNRSMVLPPTSEVDLSIEGFQEADVSIDGAHVGTLSAGQKIRCTSSDTRAQFLIDRPRNFHAVLKEKFGIQDG